MQESCERASLSLVVVLEKKSILATSQEVYTNYYYVYDSDKI